jgi:hypothetical protein
MLSTIYPLIIYHLIKNYPWFIGYASHPTRAKSRDGNEVHRRLNENMAAPETDVPKLLGEKSTPAKLEEMSKEVGHISFIFSY